MTLFYYADRLRVKGFICHSLAPNREAFSVLKTVPLGKKVILIHKPGRSRPAASKARRPTSGKTQMHILPHPC